MSDEQPADQTDRLADDGAAEPAGMTLSEERVNVDTETVEAGEIHVRKHVVTEEQTTTVPLTHEEVRVDRQPVDPDDAPEGAEIGEDEITVTLHEERPVVTKETVPVERVTVTTDAITEEQQVTEQVQREQLDDPSGG